MAALVLAQQLQPVLPYTSHCSVCHYCAGFATNSCERCSQAMYPVYALLNECDEMPGKLLNDTTHHTTH